MDGSDFIFLGQCETSYVQHVVLAVAPLYLHWVEKFPLEQKTHYWLIRAVIIATIFGWNIQLPVSLLSHVNVNYMLWPPPALGLFVCLFFENLSFFFLSFFIFLYLFVF
jgi:hypothetical protein